MNTKKKIFFSFFPLHNKTLPTTNKTAFLPNIVLLWGYWIRPDSFFNIKKDYLKGWPAFLASISYIGVLTAVIGDLASHFGCFSLIKDKITAITIVALGTSVPGKFLDKKIIFG